MALSIRRVAAIALQQEYVRSYACWAALHLEEWPVGSFVLTSRARIAIVQYDPDS